jgi:hypothetical protein
MTWSIPSQSVATDATATRLIINFVSLGAMFKGNSSVDLKTATFTLNVRTIQKTSTAVSQVDIGAGPINCSYLVTQDDSTPKKSQLTLTSPTQALVGDMNHLATFQLFYKRPAAAVSDLKIKIAGKTVSIVSLMDSRGTPVTQDPSTGLFTLPAPDVYTLTVRGVVSGGSLAITGNDTSNDKLPIDELDFPFQ